MTLCWTRSHDHFNKKKKKAYMKPFLRWAGGKRWLTPKLAPILKKILTQSERGVYAEPFMGSAAMFFGLAPQKALLSDTNEDLINTYVQIASRYQTVESYLKLWPVSSDYYYELRATNGGGKAFRAARFIYLNRTCYGGLYRENQKGEFNTPYGGGSRTPQPVLRQKLLQKAHFALQNVKITSCDFQCVLDRAGEDDVVYCDPTYSNVSRGQFDRYGAAIFDWDDQKRLAASAQDAMDSGATVIVSNGYFEELVDLYPAAYRICLERNKAIGNRALDPKTHHEYLLVLDPKNRRRLWEKIGRIENRKSRKRISTDDQRVEREVKEVRVA